MIKCKYCEREFSNTGGRGAHEPHCKENPDRTQRHRSPLAGRQLGSIPWNVGLNKHTDERVAKNGAAIKAAPKTIDPFREAERVRKITEQAKLKNGGYRIGGGRGKKGWYKGFWCDSSWELAYVIYCLENNKRIVRCQDVRDYQWNGEIKRYHPDFIVDGVVTEIKGHNSEQWDAKISSNPDVRVLFKKDLKDVFSYIIGRYGKTYTDLYENRKDGREVDCASLEMT